MHQQAPIRAAFAANVLFVFSAWHDPVARLLNVDLLAVAVAILLPWSTTGVIIAMVLWLCALVPTLDWPALLRSLKRPACLAPVALFGLALAGMLWSDAAWAARLHAVGPAVKLLALPLLLYHFERTARGSWIFVAFLASSVLLLLASYGVAGEALRTPAPHIDMGIVVKNHLDQSHVFALCAIALAYPIASRFRARSFPAAWLLVAIALGFVANMAFVNVSRTALIATPVMLAVYLMRHHEWRGAVGMLCAAAAVGALCWFASPVLQAKIGSLFPPYRLYEPAGEPTSIDIRSQYWRRSVGFIADAPLFGHGTGSTRTLFERAATGQVGVAAEVTANPHNQTLNVAIQWGAAGVAALYAMWLLHLALFRGEGLASWIGLVVVVQNVASSLFNSHVFDFEEGWIYVLGVGVAGGMCLGASRHDLPDPGKIPVSDRAA